jgi:hypothetical protein
MFISCISVLCHLHSSVSQKQEVRVFCVDAMKNNVWSTDLSLRIPSRVEGSASLSDLLTSVERAGSDLLTPIPPPPFFPDKLCIRGSVCPLYAWTFRKRKESLASIGNRAANSQLYSLVTNPAMLSWLLGYLSGLISCSQADFPSLLLTVISAINSLRLHS